MTLPLLGHGACAVWAGLAGLRARMAAAATLLAWAVPIGGVQAATDQVATAAPLVRFAPERDYGPFVFVDADGSLAGLSVEVLQALAPRLGWQLQPLPAAALSEQLQRMQAGEAELISSVRPTPERARYLAFTAPYAQVPAILVARQGQPGGMPAASGVAGRIAWSAWAGRAVAVGAGYAVEGFVREVAPQVAWQRVPDDVQALLGVFSGRFEAAVLDAASAAFIQRRHRLHGLASLGGVGFDYALCFAVPLQRQDLLKTLDEAIRGMPEAERRRLHERWIAPLQDDPMYQRPAWPLLLAAGLMALGGAAAALRWWRLRQPRELPSSGQADARWPGAGA